MTVRASVGINQNSSTNEPNSSASLSKSSTSSTCSSSSPASHLLVLNPSSSSLKISMEEVWNNINSTASTPTPTTHYASRSMILQDFFSKPFKKSNGSIARAGVSNFMASEEPPTSLALNSGSDDPDETRDFQNHALPSLLSSSFDSPLEGLGSSFLFLHSSQKRDRENDDHSTDVRHKRMMKNRESAARSRARRQAYTSELELEISRLQEENARLKRQQEELRLAASLQLPKKNTLTRTLTAPF